MRIINEIIIHCADTSEGVYFDIDDITRWHTDPKKTKDGKYKYKGRVYEKKEYLPKEVQNRKGNGWSDIGYHYVVLLDGSIQIGRPLETIGAHCYGKNKHSIGVCIIGGGNNEDTRTDAQKKTMIGLLKGVKRVYTTATIHSHSDFSTKTCPSYDATKEYEDI